MATKRVFKPQWSSGPSVPPGRETVYVPSRVTAGGSTAMKETIQYTGDKMIGVSQTHKSNLVPVFSDTQAKEIATMRR